jgi:hypothetical protein
MDSTAQSGPVTALDRDTEFNIPKCTDSALGASYLVTCSAPSWTSTAPPRQPFTMATWTTGYETHNERTLHHDATYSNSIVLQQFYSCITTMAYTGVSPSPFARPTIIMSYILTPSINDTQTWNLI